MFEFLKKKKTQIVSPVCGKCISITEVPDAVFSEKILGDGFAIIPSGDVIVSPADGEITTLADTKHAVGIKTKDDINILLHVGLDTVKLKGVGFQCFVKQGEKVKAGTPLIHVDHTEIEKRNMNLTTVVVFTEGYDGIVNLNCCGKEVKAGEVLISWEGGFPWELLKRLTIM